MGRLARACLNRLPATPVARGTSGWWWWLGRDWLLTLPVYARAGLPPARRASGLHPAARAASFHTSSRSVVRVRCRPSLVTRRCLRVGLPESDV
jgi:hypothetical protein